MSKRKVVSFIAGFLVLFILYHFPEFFTAFWILASFRIGFLIAAYLLARAQGWKGLGGFGLSLKSPWFKQLTAGLLLGLVFFTLSFWVCVQIGYEKILHIQSFASIAKQLPLILLMTAVPSVAEDILTRGYIYAHIRTFMNSLSWMLLSSLLYVLNHIWRLDEGLAVLSYLFLLGMVLAYAVWLTKSLWLAFGIHWGANIAFESIHSFVETNPVVEAPVNTWILAGTWALLLAILVFIRLATNNFRAKAVDH